MRKKDESSNKRTPSSASADWDNIINLEDSTNDTKQEPIKKKNRINSMNLPPTTTLSSKKKPVLDLDSNHKITLPPPHFLQVEIVGKSITEYKNVENKLAIDKDWYINWKKGHFERSETGLTPPIDNSNLLTVHGKLKPNLKAREDYVALPSSAFQHLAKWHGLSDIKRDVVHIDDETYYTFHVCQIGKSTNESVSFSILYNSTLSEFQSSLLTALNSNIADNTVDIKLWLLNHYNYPYLNNIVDCKRNPSSTTTSFIVSQQLIDTKQNFAKQIDTRNTDISFDSTIQDYLTKAMSSFTSKSQINSSIVSEHRYYLAVDIIQQQQQQQQQKKKLSSLPPKSRQQYHEKALIGLANLGNTCYMNSAIQCLSHTPQLVEYFLDGRYKQNINKSNQMGFNGEIAEAFALLLRNLHQDKPNSSSISPNRFKSTFELHYSHFVGFHQQDSQEFLSFLLDGLHEDLNRIATKPYIEMPDFDDGYDLKEIAVKSWDYHKERNDSVIVDLFQGQYKSRVICSECEKVSCGRVRV